MVFTRDRVYRWSVKDYRIPILCRSSLKVTAECSDFFYLLLLLLLLFIYYILYTNKATDRHCDSMKTTYLLYVLSSYCLFVTVQTFFAPSSQLQQKTQNTILHQTKPSLIRLAAKKAKFSFSEDFLSALNDDDDEDQGKTKTSVNKTKPQKPSITPPSPSSSSSSPSNESPDKTQNTDEKTLKSSKSKKKDKNRQRELWDDSSDVSEMAARTATTSSSQGEAVSSEEVKEKEQRRSRLSSKIRLTERSQPSFLVMGLRGVEMTFGDETVLKNASFTVSTGERVGLVGPNGGGKVSDVISVCYFYNTNADVLPRTVDAAEDSLRRTHP